MSSTEVKAYRKKKKKKTEKVFKVTCYNLMDHSLNTLLGANIIHYLCFVLYIDMPSLNKISYLILSYLILSYLVIKLIISSNLFLNYVCYAHSYR